MPQTQPPDLPLPPAQRPAVGPGPRRSFPTLRTVSALILREMGARYGKSPFGFFWALMSPMILILVLSFAFSLLQRAPSLGSSFILYYASGQLTFSVYAAITGPVQKSLTYTNALLQFPTVTWFDAILARFLLNLTISMIVFFILIYAVAFLTGSAMRFDIGLLLASLMLTAAIGFGFGTLTCYVFMEGPVIGDIWHFASRPLFIASGVLFMYEDMPQLAQDILYWNPLMHTVSLARAAIYPRYDAAFASPAYVLGVAMVMLVFGLFLVRQHHDRLLSRST